MSVWCEVKGTMFFNIENHKFSLKKYTKLWFSEYKLTVEELNQRQIYFSLSFTGDRMDAAECIENWLEGIPASYEIVSEIRWLK